MAVTRLETRLTAKDDTGRAFRSLQASMATADRAFVNLTKVAAGLGAVFGGIFIRDLVDVNKKFQSLQASLVTFTGSTEKAKGAFNILKEFAKTTPFSLDEVVGSFNVLIAQGIKPTEAQLRSFADIAGGTSKSILQFSEAVADASVGEFERLKEFGIKTKKEGESITFTIGDLTKSVNNDADSILAALAEIGATKFADGAARQAETLGGSFTNLRDTIDEFMFEVGEAGLAKELSKTVRSFTSVIGGNKDLAKSLSDTGVKAIRYFVDAIRFMRNNLDTIFNVLKVVFGLKIIQMIIAFGSKLLFLGRIVTGVTVVFGALNLAVIRIPAIIAAAIAASAALVGKFGELKDAIEGTLKKADQYLGVTKTAKQLTDELGLSTILTTEAYEEFKKETGVVNDVLEKNVETLEDVYGANKKAGEAAKETFGEGAIRGVKEYYDSIKNGADNAAEFTGNAFRSLQDTLSEFFQTGKINFGSFLDALKRGLADLAAKAVITTGLNFLGSVFPSIGGSSYDSTAMVGFAQGGFVPGSGGPKEDNILARLSSGEYVIQASTVNRFGRGFFDQLNAGQLPGGQMSVPGGDLNSAIGGFGFGGFVRSIGRGVSSIGRGIGAVVRRGADLVSDLATGIVTGDFDKIVGAIEDVVGAVQQSVKNMINGILSGDPMTIALLASSFILPGLGGSIMGALGPGLGGSFGGFLTGVSTGISNSFAAGVLGSGSLSAIATSVGLEFAKGAVINGLVGTLTNAILGGTGTVTFSKSAYDQQRADAFATLYNKSAPYLARAQGGQVMGGDNVLVGERGAEMFIPNRNGTIAPIKSNGGELIKVIVSMKDEIVSLRRDMARVMSGQALAGSRV